MIAATIPGENRDFSQGCSTLQPLPVRSGGVLNQQRAIDLLFFMVETLSNRQIMAIIEGDGVLLEKVFYGFFPDSAHCRWHLWRQRHPVGEF